MYKCNVSRPLQCNVLKQLGVGYFVVLRIRHVTDAASSLRTLDITIQLILGS